MKQLKKMTRKQKVLLDKYFKKHDVKDTVNNYGLVEHDRFTFTVALKSDPRCTITIYNK